MAPRSSSPSRAIVGGGLLLLVIVGGLIWALGGDDAPADPGPRATTGDAPATAPDGALPKPISGAVGNQPEQLEPTDLLPDDQAAAELESDAPLSTILAVGRVVDAAGEPLADMEVNLYDALGEYTDSEVSDADGRFEFHSDEPLVGGWSLGTEPDLYSDQDDPASLAPAHHTVTARWVPGNPPAQVELVIRRAPRIEGRVVDDATGQPVDFADVELVSTLPGVVDAWQDTFTEEDGTFAMSVVDIPFQQLVLRGVDDSGDESRVAILGPFDMQPGETRYVELRTSAGFDLTGVVRDLTGNPVDGAEVYLLPLHPDFEYAQDYDVTLDDGVFRLAGIPPGDAPLMLYCAADGYAPAMIRPAEPRAPVDILLTGLVSIEGTVLDSASGSPIDGADLTFVLRGPGGLLDDFEDYGFSDTDGSYSVPLEFVAPNACEVFVEADGFVTGRFDLADMAPVENGWLRYEIDFRLDPLP